MNAKEILVLMLQDKDYYLVVNQKTYKKNNEIVISYYLAHQHKDVEKWKKDIPSKIFAMLVNMEIIAEWFDSANPAKYEYDEFTLHEHVFTINHKLEKDYVSETE